jgi:hypothetical protein
MPDDLDNTAGSAADVLRSLERALAVAERRRRLRLGLALVGAALLVVLVVLIVMLLAGGLERWTHVARS